MKKILLKINFGLEIIGFNLMKFISFFRGLPFFIIDFVRLKKQMKKKMNEMLNKMKTDNNANNADNTNNN